MWPNVGEVCKFSFIEAFNSLNGIYRVLSVNTLDELIALEVNITESTYLKVGLTEEDYLLESPEYEDDKIYKLEHVETLDVIYMPLTYNLEIPDPNIMEYLKLGFAVDIGVFSDQEQIAWIQNQLSQILLSIGVETSPTLFEIEPVWMTESEYDVLAADRAELKSGELTHYYDKEKLILENTRLKSIISYYETTYKTLFGTP